MVKQKINSFVQGRLIIEIMTKSERIKRNKCGMGI